MVARESYAITLTVRYEGLGHGKAVNPKLDSTVPKLQQGFQMDRERNVLYWNNVIHVALLAYIIVDISFGWKNIYPNLYLSLWGGLDS